MPETEAATQKEVEYKNEQREASFLTVSLTLWPKTMQVGNYKRQCQGYTHIHKQIYQLLRCTTKCEQSKELDQSNEKEEHK